MSGIVSSCLSMVVARIGLIWRCAVQDLGTWNMECGIGMLSNKPILQAVISLSRQVFHLLCMLLSTHGSIGASDAVNARICLRAVRSVGVCRTRL